MYSLTFILTTRSPVIFPIAGGDPNAVQSTDYIPGSSLLGALASRFIRKHHLGQTAHEDNGFQRLFLSGQVVFNTAYITQQNQFGKFIRYVPTPLSIQKNRATPEIHDQLLSLQVGAYRHLGGYLNLEKANAKIAQVKKQILYHHAKAHHHNDQPAQEWQELKYEADPIPFTYEAIQAGQSFYAEILGEEADLETLKVCIHSGGSFNKDLMKPAKA